MTAWIGLLVLILAGLVLVLRGDQQPIGELEAGDFASLMTGLALLIFIGGGALLAYRGRASQMVKDLAVWMAITLVLVAGYSYRSEFRLLFLRVGNELMPGLMPVSLSDEQGRTVVEIPRRDDNHFVARVRVNGEPVDMLIDTGASNVLLTAEDAVRAGLDPSRLAYSLPATTANGRTMIAPVELRAVSVGAISIDRVRAAVAQPGTLDQSLLGMSFLNRLQSYEVSDGRLVLRN